MPNNDTNVLIRIVSALFKAFCGADSKPNQQQQYGNYNQQQQPQQQWNQQQQAYPPQQQGYPGQQNQQSWSQVASGPPGSHGPPGQHQNGQHQSHPNQHHGKPHHNNQQNHQNNYQNNYQNQNQNQYQNQYQQQQNGGYPSKPYGLPAGGIIGPHHQGGQDPNMVNQANEKYVGMRNQARHEGDESHR